MVQARPHPDQEARVREILRLYPDPPHPLAEAYAAEKVRKDAAAVDHFARELGLDHTDPAMRERILRAVRGWYGLDKVLAEQRMRYAAKRHHDPVVYYMRMGGLVKIGTTASIVQRYETIQPQGVMAIEFGSYELEAERHRQFGHLHDHGEWFRLADDLGVHIADLREHFAEAGTTVEEWLAQRLPPRRRRTFSA